VRLDRLVVARGLARSRSHAQELIRAGRVRVGGRAITRPGVDVPDDLSPDVETERWVGRAAHKLLGALADLPVPIPDRALDLGASTGGFTQVLLERGCGCVYAVDVGHDQLAPALRADPRVRNLEGHHLRDLTLDDLDRQPVRLVVADVSFISLRLAMAPLTAVTEPGAYALLLVKPQFEVGREGLDRRGVVRDESARLAAVDDVARSARDHGWAVTGQARSRLPGPAGNVEYFLRLVRGAGSR